MDRHVNLADRVLHRYKSAANKALTDAEYQKTATDVLAAIKRIGEDTSTVREGVVNMALTLKDRGHFRDASTLMEMAPDMSGVPEHLSAMVERLKKVPADMRKSPKPGPKPNPWTKPL